MTINYMLREGEGSRDYYYYTVSLMIINYVLCSVFNYFCRLSNNGKKDAYPVTLDNLFSFVFSYTHHLVSPVLPRASFLDSLLPRSPPTVVSSFKGSPPPNLLQVLPIDARPLLCKTRRVDVLETRE